MGFRCIKQSNDGDAWLASVISFGGVVVGGLCWLTYFHSAPVFPKILLSVIFVGFIAVFAVFMRRIVFPVEWELVVDDGYVRWGPSCKPDKQQRLPVPQILRLVYDKPENQVLADTGGWRLLPVANYILLRADDQTAFVEYMRQNFPQLKIEVR